MESQEPYGDWFGMSAGEEADLHEMRVAFDAFQEDGVLDFEGFCALVRMEDPHVEEDMLRRESRRAAGQAERSC